METASAALRLHPHKATVPSLTQPGAVTPKRARDLGMTGAQLVSSTRGGILMLAEVDWIRSSGGGKQSDQLALYTGVDFEAVRGLYARFAFEAFDPLRSMKENERDRFVMGLSWFPIRLLQVRVEYRLNRDIPQRPEGNADEINVEIHGFL